MNAADTQAAVEPENGTTYCDDCRNVDAPTRKQPWWNWRCLMAPKDVPIQFVVADPWLTTPPFEKCCDINSMGNCTLFEQRKEDDGN